MSWKQINKEEIKEKLIEMNKVAGNLKSLAPSRTGLEKEIFENYSLAELALIQELFEQRYVLSDVKAFVYQALGKNIKNTVLTKIKEMNLGRFMDFSREKVEEAKLYAREVILSIRKGYFDSMDIDIERLKAVRTRAEMLLIERIQKQEIDSQTLRGYIKDLWDREQLLQGKPTNITKDLTKLSDEELIKQAYELNPEVVQSYLKDGKAGGDDTKADTDQTAEGDFAGTEEETEGGEDTILEAA